MNNSNLEKVLKDKISANRLEDLRYLWHNETNDEETQEWRKELTADEEALVDLWDNRYNDGIIEICRAILKAEQKNKQ